MSSLDNFALEYEHGRNDGRNEILADIAFIMKRNKYPEYIERDLCDYLESKGVKLNGN